MNKNQSEFEVQHLGECKVPSPMKAVKYTTNQDHVLYHSNLPAIQKYLNNGKTPPVFEMAGPREKIYYNPAELKCAIVTCGGLCPGLNDVIRAIVLGLFHHYGVRNIIGFPFGYEGLTSKSKQGPVELTPSVVENIHMYGGTMLGSSRGPQDVAEMVDTLQKMNINILFTIGGDGTLRGAQDLSEEIHRRNLSISVIGIPKTIDNDISFLETSFGFETAVAESRNAIFSAHAEALGARNGIGLVKLMGRESGFIAAYAALANSVINFCLVPEVPFTLDAFLHALKVRIENRGHAVVVVAEGAGQNLFSDSGQTDASGNSRFEDIGIFLKESIKSYFKDIGFQAELKYIDPSYTIRSQPANARDSAFCLSLGHNAVHAAMIGRTNMVVGFWKNQFTYVPIPLAVSKRKHIDPKGWMWSSVLSSTGQPSEMV